MAITMFNRLKSAFKKITFENVVMRYLEDYVYDRRYTNYFNEIERVAERDIMSIRDANVDYGTIKSMLNDAQVYIGVKMRQLSVVGKGGCYQNEKYPHIAQHINNCLKTLDVPFVNYIELLLECIPYGWKSMEKIWDIVDYQPVLKGFIDHPQDLTEIYMKESKCGLPVVDYFKNYGAKIPGQKCLYMTYDQKNKAPHGCSALDPIYKNWLCADRFTKYECMYLERQGVPPVIVKMKGFNDGTLDRAYDIINKLHGEAGVPIDSTWDISLLETDKKGGSYFTEAINYHDEAKLRGLLYPTGLLDEGKAGTYGAADIRFEVFKWVIERDRVNVAHVLNNQLFNEWVYMLDPRAVEHGGWNWFPYQEIDWLKISEGIKDLFDCKVFNEDIDPDYIRENFLKMPSLREVHNQNVARGNAEFLKNIEKMPSTIYRSDALIKAKNDIARVKLEKEQINNDREIRQKELKSKPVVGERGTEQGTEQADTPSS